MFWAMRKIGKIISGILSLLLVVLLLPWISAFVLTFPSRKPVSKAGEIDTSQVGIVFGASVLADGTPSRYLATRLDVAAQLYHQGKVKVLLVSGDSQLPEYDETTAMRNYLIAKKVPASKIVIDKSGLSTYDTCRRAKQVYQIDSATLITQKYHLPRAMMDCKLAKMNKVSGVNEEGVKYRIGIIGDYGREIAAAWVNLIDSISGKEPKITEPTKNDIKTALAAKP